MYCTHCGTEISKHHAFCSTCGQPQGHAPRADRAPDAPVDSSLKWIVPVNTSPYAIVSCYSALLGFFLCGLFIPSIVAIVFGMLALSDIKKRPHLAGKGRAWFGLIVGAVSIALAIVLIVMWLSSPDPFGNSSY